MAVGQVTAKVVLTIIDIVFCVIAIILMMIGAWLFSEYFDYHHVGGNDSTLIPACLVLATGLCLFIMGIVGFIVTYNDFRCLTSLFLFILAFLLVVLIVGSALAYVYHKDIDVALKKQMLAALDEYAWDKYVRHDVDFMQSELECCGVDNYTDWLNTSWYRNQSEPLPYPSSCCKANCTYHDPDTNLYKEGCYKKLRSEFLDHLVVVGSVAGGCALILLLGVICSAFLLYRRSREPAYIGLPEADGLQV